MHLHGIGIGGINPAKRAETTYDFTTVRRPATLSYSRPGSACGPVIVPVFKTGGWQAILSPVGSTPTRFRQLFFNDRVLSAVDSYGAKEDMQC